MRSLHSWQRAFGVCLAFGFLLACASTPTGSDEELDDIDAEDAGYAGLGPGETLPSVAFEGSAELNWQRAEKAYADEEYLRAQRYFGHIRRKFPYSRLSPRAAVRIADCLFERSRFPEAIDSYQNFVRMHPTHERVPYAGYRIGVAHYEQLPSDWFALPPSEEKDQTAAREAERALKDYLGRFPDDMNVPKGRALLRKVIEKLIAHERYVADFYRKLGKDAAFAGRLEAIRKRFPEVGADDTLLLELAEVYTRLGRTPRARGVFEEMRTRFPESPKLKQVESLLPESKRPKEEAP